MAGPLELDELIEHFTLVPTELELLHSKTRASRLGLRAAAQVPSLERPVPRRSQRPAEERHRPRGPPGKVAAEESTLTTGPEGRSSATGWRFAGRSVSGSAASPRRRS